MNIERKHAAVFLRHVFVFIEEMSFEQLEYFEPFEYEIMLINGHLIVCFLNHFLFLSYCLCHLGLVFDKLGNY